MFENLYGDQESKESASTESSSRESGSDQRSLVVSLGGSLVIDKKPNTTYLAKFANSISSLSNEGYKFAVVVGGGKTARDYVAATKIMGANNFEQDIAGIEATRLNARLVIQALDSAHPSVVTDFGNAKRVFESGRVPVMGGMLPSFTTDAVSALLAEYLNASLFNLTNVDGIYSQDPKKYSRATFYPELSYDRLISLMKLADSKPGQNLVLDLPSCLILKRSSIRAIVLDGEDLDNFEAAVRGGEYRGTLVRERIAGGDEED